MSPRLEIAADKLEIAELVHEYARLVRREEYEGLAALFVPEGTFEVRRGHPDRPEFEPQQRFDTPGDLVAYLVSMRGKPHPVPLIHNLIVRVEGDAAHASSSMTARVYGTDHSVAGEYLDRFTRSPEGWRFAARTYTIYAGRT